MQKIVQTRNQHSAVDLCCATSNSILLLCVRCGILLLCIHIGILLLCIYNGFLHMRILWRKECFPLQNMCCSYALQDLLIGKLKCLATKRKATAQTSEVHSDKTEE